MNILLFGQLKYLSQFYEVIAVSGPGEDLDEVQKRETVSVRKLEMRREPSILHDIKSLIQLYLLFRNEKPILVHSITPKAGLLSMVAAKLAKVPIRIHTFTGLLFPTKSGLLRRVLIFFDKVICWSSTNVYPEGNGVLLNLKEFKITRKQLRVIANGNINGIDINWFNPDLISYCSKVRIRNKYSITKNSFVYTYIGRIVGDKGINELVKSFCQLSIPQKKLLIIGDLELKSDPILPETYSEILSNENIILIPFQKDIRVFLSISNAFVFPSYREGFPNVVLQAGAMEIPCIVTDINGCNEIVKNNVNGLIVPPKNTNALKSAMLYIYENDGLREYLKSNSRNLVRERYQNTVVWNCIHQEYERLINDYYGKLELN
jgi:glycosyltransferase involved in cell wall biosynthesis